MRCAGPVSGGLRYFDEDRRSGARLQPGAQLAASHNEEELRVGQRFAFVGLQESGNAAGKICRKAGPEQVATSELQGQAIQSHVAVDGTGRAPAVQDQRRGTRLSPASVKRFASVHPAEPAPTTM